MSNKLKEIYNKNKKIFNFIGIFLIIYIIIIFINLFINKNDSSNTIKPINNNILNTISGTVIENNLNKITEIIKNKVEKLNSFQFLEGIKCGKDLFIKIGNKTEIICEITDNNKFNKSIDFITKYFFIEKNSLGNKYIYDSSNYFYINKLDGNNIKIIIDGNNNSNYHSNKGYLNYIITYTDIFNLVIKNINSFKNLNNEIKKIDNFLNSKNKLFNKNIIGGIISYNYSDFLDILYLNEKDEKGNILKIKTFNKEIIVGNKKFKFYIIYGDNLNGKNLDSYVKYNDILIKQLYYGFIINDIENKKILLISKN